MAPLGPADAIGSVPKDGICGAVPGVPRGRHLTEDGLGDWPIHVCQKRGHQTSGGAALQLEGLAKFLFRAARAVFFNAVERAKVQVAGIRARRMDGQVVGSFAWGKQRGGGGSRTHE